MDDILDAGAILLWIQVVMTDNHGFGISSVQFLKESSHSSLLPLSARVGRLTSCVVPALVADAYRVGIVVLAVGTDHPFRTAWLYRSVTTDHVMVAYAEVEASLAMPCIDLSDRTCLVRLHCRTMNDN